MDKIAIYAGSFDPFTLGHLDVVMRAQHTFGRVIVLVGYNAHKQALIPVAERVALIQTAVAHLPEVTVHSWSGLTVDFAKGQPHSVLVRAVRHAADLVAESALAWGNASQWPAGETWLLLARPQWQYVSSSLVRELWQHGGDYENMVPANIYQYLRDQEYKL